MPETMLNMAELFCGAGGLGVGFLTASHPTIAFNPLFAVDNDKLALRSYKNNLSWLASNSIPEATNVRAIHGNVTRLRSNAIIEIFKKQGKELDLLAGGPPCQGYSSSNRGSKQPSKDERNNLTATFLNKVEEFCPKMFLLENVQGVKWTEPTEVMQTNVSQLPLLPNISPEPVLDNVQQFLVQRAKSLGYKVWYDIIDAADFGVPQHRMRFFLFGIRDDLVPENLTVTLGHFLSQLKCSQQITVGEAIGDLPEIGNGEIFAGEYSPSPSSYVRQMRQFMEDNELYDHFTTRHKDYVIERFKRIPQGENWEAVRDMMTTYTDVDRTHSNIYRRLQENEPANTITHYRKSMVIHPTQHRGLSFREACRLQSFPDWFRFEGGSEAKQQQLANAVPPMLAQKVAYAIAAYWNTVVNGGTALPSHTVFL